jgi:hypothetical protein
MAKRASRGPQGLSNLNTWRLPFSEDVKRRRQQKRELRRPHRLRAGGRPDSLLGTVTAHWTDVPKPDGKTKAVADYRAKGRGGLPQHEPVFFASRPKRVKHRSARPTKRHP